MTGLESIISIIKEDSEKAAAGIIAGAEAEAEEIIGKAKAQGAVKSGETSKTGEAAAKDILDRAESSAQHETRKMLLTSKQEIIKDVIEEAKQELAALGDSEYFEVLLRLVQKFSRSEDGEMLLSAEDFKRMPKDFESLVNARARGGIKISESSSSAKIKNGFLLIYGGIDINCTFDALFEDSYEALQDKVSAILFA